MWLSSYLSDRSQFVNLDEINSDIYKVYVDFLCLLMIQIFFLPVLIEGIMFISTRNWKN